MKKIIFAIAILLSTSIIAQIQIGPDIQRVYGSDIKFSKSNIDKLKKTTTIFVYREKDRDYLDLLISTLNSSWNFTPLEFVSYDEFLENNYDNNYSFFTIGGLHKDITSGSGMNYDRTYIYLNLWMNGNKDEDELYFCRIELYPTFETYANSNKHAENDKEFMMRYLYEEATMHNWNIVYLKNALQTVEEYLSDYKGLWMYKDEILSEIGSLEKDTLYILDYALIKFNPQTGNESERHDIIKLMEKYPYPYKVVSTSDLTAMILNSKNNIYYLSYIKCSSSKFVNIINGRTGKNIYGDHANISYNINSKDFKKIAKGIKKHSG